MGVYIDSKEKGERRIYWGDLLAWYQDNPEELIGKTTADFIEDIVGVVIVADWVGEGEPQVALTLNDILNNYADYGIDLSREKNALSTIIREGKFSDISGTANYTYGQLPSGVIPDLHTLIYNITKKVDDGRGQAMSSDVYEQQLLNWDVAELDMLYNTFEVSDQRESAVNAIVGDSEITGLSASSFLAQKTDTTGQPIQEYYGLSTGYIIGEDGVFISAYDLESDPVKDQSGNIVKAVFKYGDADKLALELSADDIKQVQDLMIFLDAEQYAKEIENIGRLSTNNIEIIFLASLMAEANNSILANALNPDVYDNIIPDYNSDLSDWTNLGFGSNKKNVVQALIDKKVEVNELDTITGSGSEYWKRRANEWVNPSEQELEAAMSTYFNNLGLNMTSSDAVRFGKYLLETRGVQADREREIENQYELLQSVLPMEETLAKVTEKPQIQDYEDKALYAEALKQYEEYKLALEEGRVRTVANGNQYISATEEFIRQKYKLPKLESYNSELEFNKLLNTELADRIGAVNTNKGLRTASAKFQNRFMSAQSFLTGGK